MKVWICILELLILLKSITKSYSATAEIYCQIYNKKLRHQLDFRQLKNSSLTSFARFAHFVGSLV